MKSALVTGCAGFAGRHFTRALEERGYFVRGIDTAYGEDALGYFSTNHSRFRLVVHCAAVVGGRAVIDGDPLAQAVNLQLDAAMFRWALRAQPGRVVYVSSSAAYPVPFQTLEVKARLTEDMIDPTLKKGLLCMPDQLYGWAKLTGENLAHRARQAGLEVTVVRPFSGYGEDQDESYPFRAFAERARARADPFEIWGNPYQCRDFIHIDDIVGATLRMCDQGIDGPVNLGTGIPTTMEHLAALFTRAAGYKPRLNMRKDAPMGVEYRVADVSALNEFYLPRVSLEEGVKRALA